MKAAGRTYRQIATSLNRTIDSVRRKYRRRVNSDVERANAAARELDAAKAPDWNAVLRIEPLPANAPEPDEKLRVDYWRKQVQKLQTELFNSQAAQTAEQILSEKMLELAPRSYQPPNWTFNPDLKKSPGSPQSAVLMFSDTHIGAVIRPEQTLRMGEYNFELFLRRLHRLERSIFSILDDHTTTPIQEIVVPILGDMLDGALTHSAESGQENTMLAQFYSGGHAIAQFLQRLSVIAPLRIYATVGNHTRWQNQHRMPTKNRNSNFDQLLYLYIQALTRDIPRIAWHIDWQPFATFEVQGFPFYALHGDNIRGGDKMLGIPNHALGRMVGTTTQLFSRSDRDIPAYYLLGHLHRPIELPHANGEILINGAFPGIDGFALSEFFNSSRPSQRFFLMHPKFGIAASYKLRLDLGDSIPHDYTLPTEFCCK